MANPFDVFDQSTATGNPFDTFDTPPAAESAAPEPTAPPDSGPPNGQPQPQFIDGLFGGPPGFEAQPPPVDPTAPIETALHLITGTPATIVGTAAGVWETLMKGDPKAFDPAREAATTGGVLEAITYEPRGKGASKFVEQIGRAFQGFSEGLNALAQTEEDLMGPGSGAAIKIAGEVAPFLIGAKGVKGKAKVEPEVKPTPEAPPAAPPLQGEVLPKAEPPPGGFPTPPPDLVAEWKATQQEAPRAAEATRDGILPDNSAPDPAATAAAREDAGIPPVGKTEAEAPTMVLDLRNGSAPEHVAPGVERANDNLVQSVAGDVAASPPDVKMNTAATAGKERAEAGGATPSALTVLSSPSHLSLKPKFRKLRPYIDAGIQALRKDRKYAAHFNERLREVERTLSPGSERLRDFGVGLRARRQEMNDLLLEQSMDPDVSFTRESLTARGVEPKVINGFFKMQNLYKAGFRANNMVRKSQGLEPLTPRKNYVHHLFGQYYVVGREAGGQPKILASHDSLRAAVAAAEQAKAPGLEVGVQIKTPQFNDLNRNAQVLGDKNFFALRTKIQKDLELTADEAHDLLHGITRPRPKGRSPGFLKFRENKPGWMTDMDHVHRVYFNNLSRHLALDPFKRATTKRFEKDFGPPDKAEGMGAYVKKYMEDVNGVPHVQDATWNRAMLESPLGKVFEKHLGPTPFNEFMRGTGLAVSTLKLGLFNVGSAMVNATQFLGAHAVLGPTYFANGFTRAMRQMANGGVRYLSDRDLSPSARKDRRLLREMGIEYGADNIAQLAEGTSRTGKVLRSVGSALQSSMVLFTGMEYALRATTALGAYHKAIAKGIPHRAALDYAAHTNDRVNFDYSIADAGSAFRSGAMMNEVLRFKKFPVKYIEFMRDLHGAEHARFWVPYLALAGIYGFPGSEALGSLVEFASGWNPMTAGKQAIQDGDLPDWAKNVSNYGLPALAGIDASRRTGVGDAIPNELSELVPVMAASAYKGLAEAAHQNWSKALKQITPAPVNVYEAIENDQMLTPWERMFKGAGFRDLEKSKQYDANTYKQMTQAQKNEFRDDYGRTVAKGTPEEQSTAYLAARQAGVTKKSLRKEAKQNSR